MKERLEDMGGEGGQRRVFEGGGEGEVVAEAEGEGGDAAHVDNRACELAKSGDATSWNR
jgi:hypothetical protein